MRHIIEYKSPDFCSDKFYFKRGILRYCILILERGHVKDSIHLDLHHISAYLLPLWSIINYLYLKIQHNVLNKCGGCLIIGVNQDGFHSNQKPHTCCGSGIDLSTKPHAHINGEYVADCSTGCPSLECWPIGARGHVNGEHSGKDQHIISCQWV